MGISGNQTHLKRVLCLVAFLVSSLPASARPDAAPADAALRIVITRDLRGWLEPCDCKEGVLGGFPRRATALRDRPPDLLLDAGDLVSQASPYDLLQLRFMLALDGRLGYSAVNVGRHEAQLLRAARESLVPMISANLADEDGKLVLPACIELDRGGMTFRIVLGPELSSEAAVEARMVLSMLSLKDFGPLGRASARSPYVGSAACAACHAAVHAGWTRSSHALVLSALAQVKGRPGVFSSWTVQGTSALRGARA